MPTLSRLGIISLIILGLLTGCDQKSPDSKLKNWNEISTGIAYQEMEIGKNSLVLAKIDPAIIDLSIYQNTSAPDSLTLKKIHEQMNSLLTFNGSFYTTDFQPTGLLISNRNMLNKANDAELTNGIFFIDVNRKPGLINTEDYQKDSTQIEKTFLFAIQNGPILLNREGQIQISGDDKKKASRTAIGLDQNNQIVVIIIRQTLLNSENALSLFDFAKLLQKLNLHSVLNLDGGTSTGMVVGEHYFPEIEKVQNIIITSKAK
jgi:uncharacterized protein YigE (DUF2233 family)